LEEAEREAERGEEVYDAYTSDEGAVEAESDAPLAGENAAADNVQAVEDDVVVAGAFAEDQPIANEQSGDGDATADEEFHNVSVDKVQTFSADETCYSSLHIHLTFPPEHT
jgi:hypothetical protein